ncbi:protein Wnt-6-like [Oppia nitens]|uniref:protein Wnt-6-like n=1 Tax=Oppia nitens TaxID=1686743 RepID=UPI0023DB2AE7|nr:protein Wnt-6-like [Oppia nitens]
MPRQLIVDPNRICIKVKRLRGKQPILCKNEPEIIKKIISGAKLGINECQNQFIDRKWNCTTTRPHIRKILLRDSRETAFVHTITSAAILYEISKGVILPVCSKRDFYWKGCSDNVNFGYKKTKEFMDEGFRRRSDIKKLILLHNYEAGRLAVKNNMKNECKCHGMSGSCSFKTCWRKLPPFSEIGNRLKEKFDGAIKVMAGNDGNGYITESMTIKPPENDDIIYSEETPDFCEPSAETGSLGTKGRICNKGMDGTDGCDLLCCGRGYNRTIKQEEINCRCKFKWCCSVTCDKCKVKRKIYTCL